MRETRRFAGRGSTRLFALTASLTVSAIGAAQADQAGTILDATGVKGGLVVHVGCGDGRLTAALRANDRYLVHGLDPDAANVAKARAHVRSLQLDGAVSIEQWRGRTLPYADNLVNLVVAEELGGAPMTEVMRVLRPKGVAYVKASGQWTRTVKSWPTEMDEWTHYLHDSSGNAVARDTLVGPPQGVQWVAGPRYCRSHEVDTSVCALVSAGGRLFYILDEGLTGVTDERLPAMWSLVARDAFNGVLLWKRPIPHWGWREWKKAELTGKDWTGIRGQRTRSPIVLPRRLVAEGDRVYVTLGYDAPLTSLDAATGEVVRTYDGTKGTDEIVCSRGILLLCVRDTRAERFSRRANAEARRRGRRALAPPDPGEIVAVKADSGEVLWKKTGQSVLPLTLAINDDHVVFHDYQAVVCLDLRTGQPCWRTPNRGVNAGGWGSSHTLVAYDDVVLLLGPKQMVALSADDGKILWKGSGSRGPGVSNPPDVFVAGGLVWYGGPEGKHQKDSTRVRKSGHDPRTGEIKRTVDVANLMSPLHHFRCYRSKATERYLLWPKRGVEFVDLEGNDHMRHDWLRAPCKLGCMPCNGLLYVPPHQCFCYPGVKLSGFNALTATEPAKATDSAGDRLERGPAYGASATGSGDAGDWPTYRHDARRSGSTGGSVSAAVDRVWQAELGGKLTPPVLTGGRLFVASIDAHRLWCVDARSGKRLWDFTADGRIDSPPTVYQGLVLFGSADGRVYCVRAADGKMVWRFRAAPVERRVVSFGRLESAWPVHGSVLVTGGVAYFAAGRSSYLDGGIHVFGLDPVSGTVRHQACVDGPRPDLSKDVGRPFDMDGTTADVLVSDGELLYMMHAVFDSDLDQREALRLSGMGDRKTGRRLVATGGLLDDSWWNRTFWMYAERWPGYYIANQSPKAGQLLVFNDTTTYAVKCYTRRNRHSPMFFPGKDGYLLFADDNENEPVLVGTEGTPKPVRWLPEVNEAIGHKLDGQAVDRDKGTGFTRVRPPKWSGWVPVRVRAMVLAGETLFVAGPPDELDPKDPMGAFEGRKGALLWAVSTADGKRLSERKLDAPPVFDGMIAAGGRLYLSTRDGRLTCMGPT